MNAPKILAQLSSLGFRVSLTEEYQLQTTGPKGVMVPELKEAIRFHKAGLVDLLRVIEATQQALELFQGSRLVQEPTIFRIRQTRLPVC